jgi:hypothetical protein
MTRETVLNETPAKRATSFIVGIEEVAGVTEKLAVVSCQLEDTGAEEAYGRPADFAQSL